MQGAMDTLEAGAVQRKPMKEQVYDVLHENILAGRYAAGAWLRQEEIASQLGVSMTPVREALDLLVSSGLAERVPFRKLWEWRNNKIVHSFWYLED